MKPMLACSKIPTPEDIQYPVLAQPKLDGIRCLTGPGLPRSRNLKEIPNVHIQEALADLPMFDGEIMVAGDFNSVQSAVMSSSGKPDFYYVVFDMYSNALVPYNKRYNEAKALVHSLNNEKIRYIQSYVCNNYEEVMKYHKRFLAEGFEGTILKKPGGRYKHGRSTMKQGLMLKLKDFLDEEAKIIGYTELEHNCNEATIGELGQTVRSRHNEGKYLGNTLGALVCLSYTGKEFKVGTGFTAEQRSKLWAIRHELVGRMVTFKYQELSSYGVPRFPVFVRLRDDL